MSMTVDCGNAIHHRKVGRHPRLLMKVVLGYKKTTQVNRRGSLDQLVNPSGYDL